MTNAIVTALNTFAQAYASYAAAIGIGGDINVATKYAIQDMLAQVKGLNEQMAVETIADETLWLVEKTAQKVAA